MTIESRDRSFAGSPLSDLVQQAVSGLEKSWPSKGNSAALTPLAIRKANPTIYHQIIKILPKRSVGKKSECDWGPFYQALVDQHPAVAKHWVTPERKRELALDRQAAQIVAVLRAKHWSQPLSPAVINEIYGNYQHLCRLLPVAGHRWQKRDWSPIVQRLAEFTPLWVNRQTRIEQSLAVATQRFADWLSQQPPGVISPRILQTKNPKLYNQLVNCCTRRGETDWEVVISHPLFPGEWRERWQSKRSGTFIRADITLIREALAREQPATIGPAWLAAHLGRTVWQRIMRRLPRRYGAVDWREFVTALDAGQPPEQQWGGKWRIAKAGRNALRGVQAVLDEYRAGLHTMIAVSSPEDQKIRDAIAHSLVDLAQMGNAEARQTLRRLLNNLLSEWLKADSALFYYAENNDALEKIFERGVATFRPERDGSFIDYLHRQLQLTAQVGHGRNGTLF